MKVVFFTLALDAMPYINRHLEVFDASLLDYHWYVVHGAAANVGSTKWCQQQEPRLSRDGTGEYLNSISSNPRVKVFQRQWWAEGKDGMTNIVCRNLQEPCLLIQVDSDEIWTPEQLKTIHGLFVSNPITHAYFKCRYFFGPDIFVDPDSDHNNVWLRAWRFRPGQTFISHEPPNLSGNKGPSASAQQTSALGLVFEHFAYATKAQVAFKQEFYQYKGLVEAWHRLQRHSEFPIHAKQFFGFASASSVLRKL